MKDSEGSVIVTNSLRQDGVLPDLICKCFMRVAHDSSDSRPSDAR